MKYRLVVATLVGLLFAALAAPTAVAFSPASQQLAVLQSASKSSLNCDFFLLGQSEAGFIHVGPKCPAISFARASNGTYFDYTGTLQTALTNAPRFDYDPRTLAARGPLIEEQRTNGIRNPRAEGAVVGAPGSPPTNWSYSGSNQGTVTSSIIATGTVNGMPYVDVRFFGTNNSGLSGFRQLFFDTTTAIAATVGQVETATVYATVVGGSTANISSLSLGINEYSSAPAFLSSGSTALTVGSAALTTQRFTFTRTLGSATTASAISLFSVNFNNGAVIDVTVRFGGPQFELGAFATSLILPPVASPAAATRAQEFPTVATGLWFNQQKAGTLYAEGDVGAVTQTAVLAILDDGSSTNRIRLGRLSGSALFVDGTASGSNIPLISGGSNTAGTVAKIAQSWSGFIFTGAQNGASLGTTTNGAFPVGLNRLAFSTQPTSGHLRRVQYWPRSLSASSLQQATQP